MIARASGISAASRSGARHSLGSKTTSNRARSASMAAPVMFSLTTISGMTGISVLMRTIETGKVDRFRAIQFPRHRRQFVFQAAGAVEQHGRFVGGDSPVGERL